jgi:hypothetical protein
MKKLNVTRFLFVAVLVIVCTNSYGQTSLEDALGFTETVNDVPEAPIHFLVSLFLAVGAFLGIRKIKS